MTIQEHISLSAHTTFKIGGPARYFCSVRSIEELQAALAFARSKSLPIFVLGGGSNVLASDAGFDGLVVKMEMRGATYEEAAGDTALVTAWAGEVWDDLVAKTVEWNAWGLENLSLIPGSVGASPVQNIGAYGVEVKDVIESVRTVDAETGAEKAFSNPECRFSYRDSFFKRAEAKKYIIVSATFRLRLGGKGGGAANLSYKDIAAHFAAKNVAGRAAAPTQSEVRDAVIAIRTGKFPDLATTGTAGSFWKNPIISKALFAQIAAAYPLVPSFPVDEARVKVPLAWILDNVCGLKGFEMGPASLFHKQPLVLVTKPGAKASDVDRLASHVAALVKEKTGIAIEREVEGVPFPR